MPQVPFQALEQTSATWKYLFPTLERMFADLFFLNEKPVLAIHRGKDVETKRFSCLTLFR